jgi:hypothetical protein
MQITIAPGNLEAQLNRMPDAYRTVAALPVHVDGSLRGYLYVAFALSAYHPCAQIQSVVLAANPAHPQVLGGDWLIEYPVGEEPGASRSADTVLLHIRNVFGGQTLVDLLTS